MQIRALFYPGFLLTGAAQQQAPLAGLLGKFCTLSITFLQAVSQRAVHFAECEKCVSNK